MIARCAGSENSNRDASMRVWPGRPYPLGATWDGRGVNIALYSENATRVELCLFGSADAARETMKIGLPEQTDLVWHGYFPDLHPGDVYGFRVDGPFDPEKGHRFNPHKVLLDPYAKEIVRTARWGDDMFGYAIGDPREDLSLDERDNAASAPLAAVVDPAFTWGDDRPPRTPPNKTVIYELHVKGFTQRHPDIPDHMRGSYAAIGSDAAIRHFLRLGITAVELLPVHHHVDDRPLVDRGLSNYWGYNTLAFFAPEIRFKSRDGHGDALREFKTMVRTLHAAGLEVILDVVYNHTGEGNHLGPTLSFRGIDNAAYYRLSPENKRYYTDFTGCGNTLNMLNPRVLQLIMDSLRYWVLDMHVDGFRFDLASTLARELHEVDKLGAFFDIIHQDPVLSQVKLIAEPWDLGEGGYQVGNFPVGWSEWNGKYRDCVRHFWKGDGGIISEFATRICGSSDLYAWSSRQPHASINFVTCHDGFTLNDLVSYDGKHNEANGEENRDGANDNISWNCGVEGPTDEPAIRALRKRKKRNFLATLVLSQGIPMLLAGDEMGHSQSGNNNAYCQDNELAWLNWSLSEEQAALLEFTRQLIEFWKGQPVLHQRRFFHGREIRGETIKDVMWYDPGGKEMSPEAWNTGYARSLALFLRGDNIDTDEYGAAISGDTLLILFNADHSLDLPFTLPRLGDRRYWDLIFDTYVPEWRARKSWRRSRVYPLRACSLAVFRAQPGTPR
jgi:glycogen operon protein